MVFEKGYIMTEEHREAIIEAIKRQHKINPNYGMKGKKHSEKTKLKMSLASIGKKKSKEHILNWKKSMNKLRKLGKLKTWNRGLTLRKGKYISNTHQSHKVWCSQPYNFYRVPEGMIIHHLDLNTKNNNPNNLIILDKSTHHKLHQEICKLLR